MLNDRRNVSLIGTTRHIASELNLLRPKGLRIFDMKMLREFVEKTS